MPRTYDVGEEEPATPTLAGTPHPADQRMPALVFVIALAGVALHLATGWRYGLFRDEFYYLACANHLDWGYVDHPPLSIVVLAGGRALFGDSLLPGRLLPTPLFRGPVWLVPGLVSERGGGSSSHQLLA